MKLVQDVTRALQVFAPLQLQEDYDNSGLLIGNPETEVKGVLTTLDITEAIVQEAISLEYNMIVAHHPIIFKGLKTLKGQSDGERAILLAIKHDICLYAAHTNLDNVLSGINGNLAFKLGIQDCKPLLPKKGFLFKLGFQVPSNSLKIVSNACFDAGAGTVGNYSECSFSVSANGTFLPSSVAKPVIGQIGHLEEVVETRVEMLVQEHFVSNVLQAMKTAHPYEEVAYDLIRLENELQTHGTGAIGRLEKPMPEIDFLDWVVSTLGTPALKHSLLRGKPVETVAVCGGAGAGFYSAAKAQKADAYITGDCKYHDFPLSAEKTLLVDVGHFYSEQHAATLLANIITEKKPTFAVSISGLMTNPVCYYLHGSNR